MFRLGQLAHEPGRPAHSSPEGMRLPGAIKAVGSIRGSETRYVNGRWPNPVVAIIDQGTRSGMEIFANALQVNGIPLVGAETAGAVVAGRGFLLPDNSLLVLAVVDVFVDGRRLEGNPVEPDIRVPFDFRYADGADPQLEAALDELTSRLSEG